jgi:hypothetical protein
VLCCAVLCCAVLCCAVLCCAVLCSAVLCCAVLGLGLGCARRLCEFAGGPPFPSVKCDMGYRRRCMDVQAALTYDSIAQAAGKQDDELNFPGLPSQHWRTSSGLLTLGHLSFVAQYRLCLVSCSGLPSCMVLR